MPCGQGEQVAELECDRDSTAPLEPELHALGESLPKPTNPAALSPPPAFPEHPIHCQGGSKAAERPPLSSNVCKRPDDATILKNESND